MHSTSMHPLWWPIKPRAFADEANFTRAIVCLVCRRLHLQETSAAIKMPVKASAESPEITMTSSRWAPAKWTPLEVFTFNDGLQEVDSAITGNVGKADRSKYPNDNANRRPIRRGEELSIYISTSTIHQNSTCSDLSNVLFYCPCTAYVCQHNQVGKPSGCPLVGNNPSQAFLEYPATWTVVPIQEMDSKKKSPGPSRCSGG